MTHIKQLDLNAALAYWPSTLPTPMVRFFKPGDFNPTKICNQLYLPGIDIVVKDTELNLLVYCDYSDGSHKILDDRNNNLDDLDYTKHHNYLQLTEEQLDGIYAFCADLCDQMIMIFREMITTAYNQWNTSLRDRHQKELT